LIIRQEKPSESGRIYDLVKVAFETAKVADGDEQDFVNKLRASSAYIPELALVAEEEDKLVGHIMLTKTYITMADHTYEALLLAPLSVALEYRNRGVGSKLVLESFELAKKLGYKAVFVVGDPAYYAQFGFKPTVQFGIRHDPPIPDPNVMVYEIEPKALTGVSGTINFLP
jgi:predicted N-acetyltransferase YhbS